MKDDVFGRKCVRVIRKAEKIFSTSHVIPHDRAMVLIPGVIYIHALQKVVSVWYPTEITFCRPTEGYFCRA